MLNFFDVSIHFESFWSVFEAKRCNLLSNDVLQIFRIFVLTVLEPSTKAIRNCTEIASKQLKLYFYRYLLCPFEEISITNCIYLSTKAHQNEEYFHCSGVLTF